MGLSCLGAVICGPVHIRFGLFNKAFSKLLILWHSPPLQKLILDGVPKEQLQEHQEGLLTYIERHKEQVPGIVRLILSVGTYILSHPVLGANPNVYLMHARIKFHA